MTITTLKDGKTLKRHIEDLIQLAPPFAGIYAITGTPVYTPNPGGFTQLLNAIVSQQLSLKAAKAIWQRLVDNNLVSQTAIMSASPAQLRSCGLSQQKIRYAKSLAEQQIDYSQLEHLEDEAAIATLTAVTGIGRWTAEIYLLFSLKRADIFAHNDLILQSMTQKLLNLNQRPKEKAMREIAADWSPYRSSAALLLWRYNRLQEAQTGK